METDRPDDRTAEQWARAIMEEVPDAVQDCLAAAWAKIELDLVPGAEGTVAGWRIADAQPEQVLLQSNSGLGFRGEV
ncbi:MAG TPA: hypothetical protein VFW21_14905, partial [Mycobacterium sp.]|nr:hypothetical protein [Mycobacterium sp.]